MATMLQCPYRLKWNDEINFAQLHFQGYPFYINLLAPKYQANLQRDFMALIHQTVWQSIRIRHRITHQQSLNSNGSWALDVYTPNLHCATCNGPRVWSQGMLEPGCIAKVLPKKCYNFMGRMFPKLTTDIIISYILYPGPGCTLKVPLWIWYNFRLLSCPSNWDNRVIAWATRRACSKIGLKN